MDSPLFFVFFSRSLLSVFGTVSFIRFSFLYFFGLFTKIVIKGDTTKYPYATVNILLKYFPTNVTITI